MASSIAELRENDFWNKKFKRATEVLDTKNTGVIKRSDFEATVERYKKFGNATPEQVEVLSQSLLIPCDQMGLLGDEDKLTYEEFKVKWFEAMLTLEKNGTLGSYFPAAFNIIDGDHDGFIKFEDWDLQYRSHGVDVKHAPASFAAMTTTDGLLAKENFVAYHKEYFFSAEDHLGSSNFYGPLDSPLARME